ncbi:MAG: hypothetical protein V4666_08480 [Bacteroidota bacterium]
MEFIVTNQQIEGTPAFKKLDKMFQSLVLKLANKKIISHGLLSFRNTNTIPGSIGGNNLRVLKDLIAKEI